jgi:ParB-like chromosome segregation protein Spo0J
MATIQVCNVANYIPIDKLIFHPDNVELRTISRDRLDDLKLSILEKGFYEPILVWKKNGWILAGNHRAKAAKELIIEGNSFEVPGVGKIDNLPVVFTDCDEATAKAILFETNQQYAGWVQDKLEKALNEAEKAGANLKQYGFSQIELDRMVNTSLKEAEEALDDGRTIEPPDPSKLASALAEPEFETLHLERGIHEQLTEDLSKLAVEINPHWQAGDSYTEAMAVVCQTMREAMAAGEFMDELRTV